jgi:hypothetical protein
VEVAAHLLRQPVARRLAEGGDAGADLGQAADEMALVAGEVGLDEEDVHP